MARGNGYGHDGGGAGLLYRASVPAGRLPRAQKDVGKNFLAICSTVTRPCLVTQVRISRSLSVISMCPTARRGNLPVLPDLAFASPPVPYAGPLLPGPIMAIYPNPRSAALQQQLGICSQYVPEPAKVKNQPPLTPYYPDFCGTASPQPPLQNHRRADRCTTPTSYLLTLSHTNPYPPTNPARVETPPLHNPLTCSPSLLSFSF